MSSARISVSDTSVRIVDLIVPRKDVADFLRALEAPQREETVVRALEVGVFCLERAQTAHDTEFLRRQITELLHRVETAVGGIPESIGTALARRIGTGEGQVLAPVESAVRRASEEVTRRLQEVRELFGREIDPSKQDSTLGRALSGVRDLLDPKRVDSIQGSLRSAVDGVSRQDGPLARTVKAAVDEAVRPLTVRVDGLSKEVRAREAAAEALQQTIEKGTVYEEEMVGVLQAWASSNGASVEHVGRDNHPGDAVLEPGSGAFVGAKGIRVVIEAKDQQTRAGRRCIGETLSTAMAQRAANAGLYVSRTQQGLGKDVGDWAEGQATEGPWVACTHEHVITAVRFLIAQAQIASLRETQPEVDAAAVMSQLQRVRDALDRVKVINRKAGEIRSTASEITDHADGLRTDIRDAIHAMEEALRLSLADAINHVPAAVATS